MMRQRGVQPRACQDLLQLSLEPEAMRGRRTPHVRSGCFLAESCFCLQGGEIMQERVGVPKKEKQLKYRRQQEPRQTQQGTKFFLSTIHATGFLHRTDDRLA